MVNKLNRTNKIKGKNKAKYPNHSRLTNGFVSWYLVFFLAYFIWAVII